MLLVVCLGFLPTLIANSNFECNLYGVNLDSPYKAQDCLATFICQTFNDLSRDCLKFILILMAKSNLEWPTTANF